ncbi:MAG TPA: hypothetical protein VMD53_08305 [Rhizomicrobium sp.]|nr:hypothetical protein [Rhizomicrobium sp.]
MRNWKMVGVVSAAVLAATVMASAYAPISVNAPAAAALTPHMTYAPAHKDVLHTRVAQSCIAHGGTCVINGTPCCNSTDSCRGAFPNTYCQ